MQEQSDGRGWCLATYTGTYSAWVERAANVIASHTGRTGAIIGTIQSQSAASSLCRGAWVYDAARKRTSRALEAAGFAEAVSVESGLDVLVSLVRDADGDAGLSITLSVDGQPAADVVRALELAMIAGRGEVEISAACRRRDEQQVVSWRCALVEWSIALSMDRVVDKLIGLLTFCIAGGRHTEPARRGIAPSSLGPTGGHRRPGPLEVALRQAGRRLIGKDQWAITVYQNVNEDRLWPTAAGIDLIPPVDRFWADPFLARDGDRLWVFFEELKFAAGKGTLRCIPIDSAGRIGEPSDVLEEPCHLSYPNVFRHGADWFMLPESSARGNLVLYRARRFPTDWEPVAELLSNARVVDATLHCNEHGWWMLAGSADSPGGAFDDTLHVYHARDLLGPWKASAFNPVRSDPSSSRPAGPFFRWRGKWLRPVQDCRGRYGRATHLLEVISIDAEGPVERLVASINASERSGVQCAHTYCRAGRDLAVDWQGTQSRWGKAAGTGGRSLALTPFE